MEVLDGLQGQLGEDGLVHQGLPSGLNLAVGKVATELGPAVDFVQVVGLKNQQ